MERGQEQSLSLQDSPLGGGDKDLGLLCQRGAGLRMRREGVLHSAEWHLSIMTF